MASTALNPFLLAALTPDPDPRLLPLLRSNPSLASAQDAHGYSLLHAAASYNHAELLSSLVNEFNVDVNLLDEDNETCLFVTESLEIARLLVESLGVDTNIRNEDGQSAVEKFESEGEFPEIAMYLRSGGGGPGQSSTSDAVPRLPPNMSINVASANDLAATSLDQEPDPEFRRRIEELAARDDFNTEAGQKELRDLITDAVRGVGEDERDVRRRVG